MKNLNLFTFLAVFSLLAIFSCTKEMNDNTAIEDRITADQLEFIGVEHNAMLGETFTYLKENHMKVTKDDLEAFLVSKIRSNSKYTSQSNELGVDHTRTIFSDINNTSTDLYTDKTPLSNTEKSYLDQLSEILLSDVEVSTKVAKLEQDIQNDRSLNNQQLVTLFSATQIAKYSHMYWTENMTAWNELSTLGLKEDSVAGNIASGDVAGGVGAAAGAWAVNVVVGAGTVAYGGAIVGGAVAGSVGVAVSEFIDWLF